MTPISDLTIYHTEMVVGEEFFPIFPILPKCLGGGVGPQTKFGMLLAVKLRIRNET